MVEVGSNHVDMKAVIFFWKIIFAHICKSHFIKRSVHSRALIHAGAPCEQDIPAILAECGDANIDHIVGHALNMPSDK